MDKDRMIGKWTEIKGHLQEAYGDLTDDEIEQAKGDRNQLEGVMQQKLGKTKDEARAAVDQILNKV
ncbi:CsbD family protein [uncultured Tateyamaria sp.]|uniref:CsbD family protein n=1 Tax=uncultured Tateyamaria sp. TaxID=455651 RepID=UPI0026034657|nr:CsbD family protein [uncultured Tateyamaria sp.]